MKLFFVNIFFTRKPFFFKDMNGIWITLWFLRKYSSLLTHRICTVKRYTRQRSIVHTNIKTYLPLTHMKKPLYSLNEDCKVAVWSPVSSWSLPTAGAGDMWKFILFSSSTICWKEGRFSGCSCHILWIKSAILSSLISSGIGVRSLRMPTWVSKSVCEWMDMCSSCVSAWEAVHQQTTDKTPNARTLALWASNVSFWLSTLPVPVYI